MNIEAEKSSTTYSCNFSDLGQIELTCCLASGLFLGSAVTYQNPYSYVAAFATFWFGAGFPNQIKIISETQNTNIGDRTARVINQQPGSSSLVTAEERSRIAEQRPNPSFGNTDNYGADQIRKRNLSDQNRE
ncbi:hypothetical protein [Endozoicomonas euniceicola]|uniref:Uncharacterized protein n=1 Tax=Endozoicomonas euniceicola TaxID=1234143 RepID=A0ABY6H0X0_9GAMM|nr:hypothetical protein [Endozoicomonas euniceicola]UYM18702.1 hypothetical protein NX720_12610 [Endozoicomonas euniceicola]